MPSSDPSNPSNQDRPTDKPDSLKQQVARQTSPGQPAQGTGGQAAQSPGIARTPTPEETAEGRRHSGGNADSQNGQAKPSGDNPAVGNTTGSHGVAGTSAST